MSHRVCFILPSAHIRHDVYQAVVPLSVSGRPMVVSSGMQSMETMRRVYKTVKEHNQNFAILQCTSAYPLEAEDVNLRVITVKKITLLMFSEFESILQHYIHESNS